MNKKLPNNLPPRELYSWLNKPSPPLLVDVREEAELVIAPFPEPVVHLPLSTSSVWIENLQDHLSMQNPIVVICHSGVRSLNFGIWLIDQDLGYEVWNLEGGIDAWSLLVDPSVPRY